MQDHGLSRREQAILADIERELRCDRLLDRRMRTMRPHDGRSTGLPHGHRLAAVTWAAACLSMVLLIAALSRPGSGLVGAFALSWTATLTCLLLLVCRWCRTGAAATEHRDDGDGR
ncbi:DUF3040 domain-containing protein [Streptomyces sp. NPDC003038]|uniref:DUF3040 domain-containing protein n=1 Tax=unclassified Streptomyces TaxID=2593676 RepID=UPI0033A0A157